jgi:spore germination cell wall hydrolase CwlJ-like protein
MLDAMLREVRIQALLWRHRLAGRRFTLDKETVAFAAMLAAVLLGVTGIAGFAYLDGPRIEPTRFEAAQRAAARERKRAEELRCLAENVYFEARGEPLNGQYAVAEVTLNRVRSEHFPHTICEVVHESHWDPVRHRAVADFSWTELGELSPADATAWKQAMTVADAAYEDLHEPVVPGALFYHALSVRPDWSRARRPVATIGNHIFYR